MAVIPIEKRKKANVWSQEIVSRAVKDSFRKLDPRTLYKNPIMLIVEVGAILTSILYIRDLVNGEPFATLRFELQISIWLWFTVLFANFAEAIAEGRGKAQADTLRKTRTQTTARRIGPDGSTEERISSSDLRRGDIVLVNTNEVIPGDGDVI